MENTRKHTGSKHRIRYSKEFKHELCRKFLSGNYSKAELQEKYRVKGKSRLLSWLRELGYLEYIRENSIQIMRKHTDTETKISGQLPNDVKDLENALQDAQLKAAVYCKMIEIAEKRYKIKIRKNLNTR